MQSRNDSKVNFILSEISPSDGSETGITFHLTLCRELLNGLTISSGGKFIFIFQSNCFFCYVFAVCVHLITIFPQIFLLF